MHGGNTTKRSSNIISVPRKVHRPKVVSTYEAEPQYPDVDEGYFMHESFGKTVFRPRNWDNTARSDVILFDDSLHGDIFKTLAIGTTASPASARLARQIVKNIWDVFAPEGICKTILGYEFKVDTGSSASVCCRPPSYGPNESKVITKQLIVLINNKWVREIKGGSYGAPIVLAPKPHQEEVEDIADFIWRMCVSYRALNKVTKLFLYPIGRCDDAVENLGDGAGRLYFITLDCAQGYHQIRVYYKDQDKLAFFGPDGKMYTFTVMPFGPVNAPPFYTAMIRRMQAEWTHLYQLFMNNAAATVMATTDLQSLVTPHLPRSSTPSKYCGGECLPDIIPNDMYVLKANSGNATPAPEEVYTASTTVRHSTKSGDHTIVTGSRTIIDDILSWSTSQSTLLLLFECICIVFQKYRVSLKIKKCHLFNDRF